MQLFLMRHGEAGFNAATDQGRRLTTLGCEQTLMMGQWLQGEWLQEQSSLDLVLISPYLRAQQTWQQIESLFTSQARAQALPIEILTELTPEADPRLAATAIEAYCSHYQAKNVLVIAHMPLLGYLVHEFVPAVEPPLFVTSEIKVCVSQGQRFALQSEYSPQLC